MSDEPEDHYDDDDEPADANDGYEVGYGKPPKHSQFPPGTSGNLSGRPSKRPTTLEVLRDALAEPVIVKVNGRKVKMTKREAMAAALTNKSMSGSVKEGIAFLEFLEALEKGAPPTFSSLMGFDD